MIDTGTRVKIGPGHRYHGHAGRVIEVSGEHEGSGEPRANPFHVELSKPTASGVKAIWLGAADLLVMP